jgi:hypothetical protein
MRKLMLFVFLVAIVARPAGVLGAPDPQRATDHHRGGSRSWFDRDWFNKGWFNRDNKDSYQKLKPKDTPREKTVPEPATMLLVGAAAAGFAGVRRLLRSNRG